MVAGYDLQRFIDAQDQGGAYHQALTEIQTGRKRSHWMWFVFPQLAALGRSPTAKFYGLASLAEAREYLADPVLGPRLAEVTEAVQLRAGQTLTDLFGTPDDLKFVSSMTLFDAASTDEANVYRHAFDRLSLEPDQATLSLLRG